MPRTVTDEGSPAPLEDQESGRLGIKAVSELLGVPAPTIRSWERRYGLAAGRRSAGGHRRYSEDDLTVLRRMRDEVASGRPAADAGQIAAGGVASTSDGLRAELLTSAARLDDRSITSTLDRARDLFGLDQTVSAVLLPAMREIGRLWSLGECDVAHEHLATTAVNGWLARVRLDAPPPTRPGTVILACGPDDFHTLALDCLAALLAHRGLDCRLLAARTPAASLLLAVAESEAVAAVVVSYLGRSRPAAVASIRAVAEGSAKVYYAGAAFDHARRRVGLPGTYLGQGLPEAADRLAASLPAPGGG